MSGADVHAALVFASECEVGESPCWDRRSGRLLWVDILRGTVFTGDPATGDFDVFHQSERPVGAIRPATIGPQSGFVLAEQGRLTLLGSDGTVVRRMDVGSSDPLLRANEAEPDPRGRLLVGTMDFEGTPDVGSLMSVGRDGGVEELRSRLAVPNGMTWSSDGSRFFFVDSSRRAVDAFEYDLGTGVLGTARVHCDLASADGVPDGMAIDERGFLYVAMFGGGCVHVVDPQGTVESSIRIPAGQVTGCAFGDTDMRTLYITSASYRLVPEQLARQPQSGGVFRLRVGAAGAARSAYAAEWSE